jgi:DNA-binding NtrC family response regulator
MLPFWRAPDGATALSLLDSSPTPVMLLLTDLIMPGMTGIVLAREATRRHPGLPVLCMSGYADDDAFRAALGDEEIWCIMKPFSTADMQAAIARACAGDRATSRAPLRR